MQSELKKKWIEALQNGNYKQGKRFLRTIKNEYCCLGVLCDVVGCKWEDEEDGMSYRAAYNNNSKCDTVLPPLLREEQNIGEGLQNELWKRNDGVDGQREHSFNEIADWIEANVPVTDGI